MITKKTAREIYNCYTQLEAIDKLRKEMAEEVEKVRKRNEEALEKSSFERPIPENDFGRFGKGMQLGVPDGVSSSMRLFNISPELAIAVMDEQRKVLEEKMKTLEAIVKVEMC